MKVLRHGRPPAPVRMPTGATCDLLLVRRLNVEDVPYMRTVRVDEAGAIMINAEGPWQLVTGNERRVLFRFGGRALYHSRPAREEFCGED